MKNILCLLVALASTTAYGQESANKQKRISRPLYVKFGSGYSVPIQSNLYSGTSVAQLYPNNGLDLSYKLKPTSYSAGINGQLNVGVMLNKHIALEVGSSIGINNRQQLYNYSAIDTGGAMYYSDKITSQTKNPVLLVTSVVFHTGGNAIDLYTKIGLVTPLRTIQIRETSSFSNGATEYKSYTYSNKLTPGVSSAAGLNWNIRKGVQLWAEASILSLEPYLRKRELTASSTNGVNNISTIPTEDRSILYVFSGTNIPGNSVPNSQATAKAPYSNVGLNAGITFLLGENDVSDHLSTSDKVQNIYFKLGIGYGLATSTGNAANATATEQHYYNPDYTTNSFNVKPSSNTAGLNANLGAGFLIDRHIGIELGLMLGLVNMKSEYDFVDLNTRSTQTYNGVTTIVYSDFYQKIKTYSKTPIILMPALILQTGGTKVNIYSRIGLALPVKAKMTEEMTYDRVPDAQVHDNIYVTEYSTRLTLGYNMALGTSINLGKRLKLWAEANILLLAPYVKESRLTQFTNSGVNLLNNYPDNYKTTKYDFSGSYVQNGSVLQQNDKKSYTVPYNNAGLQIGISFFPTLLNGK